MDVDQLNALLEQLRRFRADHQYVEAKRAQTGLPRRLWRTLSAFANTGGGLVLLGVDEEADFAVTGVENPGQLQSDLEDLAAEMRPSMHPIIDQVDHPQGVVIAAHIEAIPRGQRPCCHPRKGARGGSYVRVGDGDHALSDVEVNELQATKQQNDLTLRPAPQGAVISTESAVRFCKLIRQTKDRFRDSEDAEILRVWSVRSEDGELTLAGLLALGEHPQRFTSAARLRYRVQPSSSAPEGARSSGTHLEGTVGAILDQTMTQLRDDLEVYQVAESSGLMEDTDVPSEALREVVSNALIHRSFTPDLEEEPVTVEVSSSAVRVVSPGALPVRVDPEKMGVHRFSGPRNRSVRFPV